MWVAKAFILGMVVVAVTATDRNETSHRLSHRRHQMPRHGAKVFPSLDESAPNGNLDLAQFADCPTYQHFLNPKVSDGIDFTRCAVYDFSDLRFPEHGKGASVNPNCLFPNLPTYADVGQGMIGDCYLVSTIKSSLIYGWGAKFLQQSMIALQDEEFSRRHARVDCGGRDSPATETVIVRMFLPGGVPIGIKFKKRDARKHMIKVTSNRDRAHGLWMATLEQAFGYWQYLVQDIIPYYRDVYPSAIVEEFQELITDLDGHGSPPKYFIHKLTTSLLVAAETSHQRTTADASRLLTELGLRAIESIIPAYAESARQVLNNRLTRSHLAPYVFSIGDKIRSRSEAGFPQLRPLGDIIDGGFLRDVANAFYGAVVGSLIRNIVKNTNHLTEVTSRDHNGNVWNAILADGYFPPRVDIVDNNRHGYDNEERDLYSYILQSYQSQALMTAAADFVGELHAFSILGAGHFGSQYWILVSNPWTKNALVTISNVLSSDANGILTCEVREGSDTGKYRTLKKMHGMTFWIELRHFTQVFQFLEVMPLSAMPAAYRCETCDHDPLASAIQTKLQEGPKLQSCKKYGLFAM